MYVLIQGDVQTPVCILIVSKDKIRQYIDEDMQEDWFLTYIGTVNYYNLRISESVIFRILKGVFNLFPHTTYAADNFRKILEYNNL